MYPSPAGTRNPDNELRLDPGTPARRNRSSGCKQILIILLVTIGLVASLFIGRRIISVYHGVWEPHKALLHKTNSGDPVVRPLIDEKQTFDIVATVWLRTNDSSSGSDNLDQKLDANANNGIVSTLPTERAIFTETVFKGLRLKDKEIRATVKYSVPTETFKARDLNHYNLRASFVLIPTSPSLLDNLTSYSSWRNDKILFPPFRSWPDTGPAPTLQDKAIDSFGASIGLVVFSSIQSRCVVSTVGTSNAVNASEHFLPEDDAGDEDSDDEIDGEILKDKHDQSSNSGHFKSLSAYPTSKGKPVLESHPYIISRSFILAADMTKLYDRKSYNGAHKELKTNACGLALSPPNHDWKLCNEQFGKHGNMDTRLQLKMAEGEGGSKMRTHWAYAPYLTLAKSTWTPKDLVPVPINREDCTKGGRFNDSELLLPDKEFVDITWEIVYSGQTPAKLKLSEAIQPPFAYNMTDTEANRQALQLGLETMQGFRGHRLSEDRHPRRTIFVGVLGTIIRIVTTFLDLHYWYTRSSTVGISKFAATLVAAISLGKYLLEAFFNEYNFVTLVMMIASLPFQMAPFLMLKVVWGIEFGWGHSEGKGKWTAAKWGRMCLPSLNFVKATHRERASNRLDGSINWTVKLLLFISCCLAYFFFSPTSSFLIPPLGLPNPEVDKFWLHNALTHSLIFPGFIVGSGLQLWFNRQSHTFAGRYKLCAVLEGLRIVLGTLEFSTRVLGNREIRGGFSVHDLVKLIVVVVWCWQAVILPKVSQGGVSDE
ncbi:hypothetical protein BYT27DRAFT_7161118 [Phlegmacium glaucopus]|nr:hypothetical protein BYT27DRAFT_7161118 [Phlegmacium glaucopus]